MIEFGAVTPRTILVRARDLEVRLRDSDDISVTRGEARVQTTVHALAILSAFSHPRPVAEVLESATIGSQDWIDLSSAIQQLAAAGILIEPGAPDALPRGYAQPPMHIAMLDDHARTRGFIDALRAVVRDTDRVLDIGTGTGVLATAAALAGAARVTAVESSAIADAAQRLFDSNGVSERVALVRGRSTSVTLDERCDVLVTEMIGDDPLGEQLLAIIDALREVEDLLVDRYEAASFEPDEDGEREPLPPDDIPF
jgi:SAM-dependent methyltransferase